MLWGLCEECGRASHDAHISESRSGAPVSVAGLTGYVPSFAVRLQRMGHPHWCQFQRLLFRFVPFEELPGFFEVERVSVDDQLVFAGVFRDGDDALDTMAVLAEGLNDEIDVYHA
jgi:hypothetical protein